MDYSEILKNARECSGPYCKACPVCNGMACRTQVPGPGGKGTAATMLRNYQKWQEVSMGAFSQMVSILTHSSCHFW